MAHVRVPIAASQANEALPSSLKLLYSTTPEEIAKTHRVLTISQIKEAIDTVLSSKIENAEHIPQAYLENEEIFAFILLNYPNSFIHLRGTTVEQFKTYFKQLTAFKDTKITCKEFHYLLSKYYVECMPELTILLARVDLESIRVLNTFTNHMARHMLDHMDWIQLAKVIGYQSFWIIYRNCLTFKPEHLKKLPDGWILCITDEQIPETKEVLREMTKTNFWRAYELAELYFGTDITFMQDLEIISGHYHAGYLVKYPLTTDKAVYNKYLRLDHDVRTSIENERKKNLAPKPSIIPNVTIDTIGKIPFREQVIAVTIALNLISYVLLITKVLIFK